MSTIVEISTEPHQRWCSDTTKIMTGNTWGLELQNKIIHNFAKLNYQQKIRAVKLLRAVNNVDKKRQVTILMICGRYHIFAQQCTFRLIAGFWEKHKHEPGFAEAILTSLRELTLHQT